MMMIIERKLFFKGMIAAAIISLSHVVLADTHTDRLNNVERVVQSHTQLLQELQNQLNDMNQEIDTLRGNIQVLDYQLHQTVERQKQILLQLDKYSAEKPLPDDTAHSIAARKDNIQKINNSSSEHINHPTTTQESTQLSSAKPNSERVSSSQNNLEKRLANIIVLTGDDKKDYDAIISLILSDKSHYKQGIATLQEFVTHYPKSSYLPNAYYWLGQLNYVNGDKEQAIFYFATVVKNYPKSDKTSDAMYKVALLLQEKGQRNDAMAIYQQILKLYPNTPVADKVQKQLNDWSKHPEG